MKTSEAAGYLNTYLTNRLDHPLTFESNEVMMEDINNVQTWMDNKYPELRENPFITAVLVASNQRLATPEEPQVDNFRLFNTCLAYLSMTRVDEISPAAITVFAKLANENTPDQDKFRVANLLANTLIRADELDRPDREKLRQSCADAASEFKDKGFFTRESQQRISKSVGRDHGRDFVKLLGFDIHNIPSLRNEAAQQDRKSTNSSSFARG